MPKKKTGTPDAAASGSPPAAAAAGARTFSISLPTAAHRDVFAAMVDKHEKGTMATINTVTSFGGDKHVMDAVIAICADFKRQASIQADMFAPRGDAAAADTSLGEAIDAALKGPDAPVSGEDGVSWLSNVPKPRPAVSQLVRWPTGQAESIKIVLGWLDHMKAFNVVPTSGDAVSVVPHVANADGDIEWWILPQLLDYKEPRNIPAAPAAEDTAAAVQTDAAVAATETPAPAAPAAPKKGKPHPGPVAEGPTQRERNAARAGVGSAARPLSPVPKPGTKKKGGK